MSLPSARFGVPVDEVDGDGVRAGRNRQSEGARAGVGADVLDAGEEGAAVGQVEVRLRGGQQVLALAAG